MTDVCENITLPQTSFVGGKYSVQALWYYDICIPADESDQDIVSRKPQYKDVYRRTIEIPQRTHLFKVNCHLKVHNVHQKLLSPISG